MPSALRPAILGQFGPPTLACIRSWGRQGYKTGMICVHAPGEPPPRSRYLSDHALLPKDKLHTDEGIDIVAAFLKSFQASGLTCINEETACLLQDNKHKLPSATDLWLPPKEVIQNVLSKERQIKAALETGLMVLPTYLLDSSDYAVSQIEPRHFPLCLRPSGCVLPHFKVRLLYSARELCMFLNQISFRRGIVIAQPFKNLPNLVIHGARGREGNVFSLQAFLVDRKFEGVTLTIRSHAADIKLFERCAAFVKALGLSGPFHLEFLYNPNTKEAWFLEINARIGGTTSKVMACGYDEPLLALQSYGMPLKKDFTCNKKKVTNRIALAKYMIELFRTPRNPLDYPDNETKLLRFIRTVFIFFCYTDDTFQFKDISGSLQYLKSCKGL